MRAYVSVFVMLSFFVLCISGCSSLFQRTSESVSPIVGTWISYDPGAQIIFSFSPDNTMYCSVPEAPEYDFSANYVCDFSQETATIDLENISSSGVPVNCLGIVRFNEANAMEFAGSFGTQPERPTRFSGSSDNLSNIYLRFTRQDQ